MKILSLLATIIICSASFLFSQTATPTNIKILMQAVEERHDAVEESLNAGFKLRNKFYEEGMAAEGAVIFAEENGDIETGFTDSILNTFKKPTYEFLLTERDHPEAHPEIKYTYRVRVAEAGATSETRAEINANNRENRERAEAAQIAARVLANETLVAANELEYDDSNDLFIGTKPGPDRALYYKEYWNWVFDARQKRLEGRQNEIVPFNRSLSEFTKTYSNHPDNAARNAAARAEWDAYKQRQIDAATREKTAEDESTLLGLGQDETYDRSARNAWEVRRETWLEAQRDAAREAYSLAASNYHADIEQLIATTRYQAAVTKYRMLNLGSLREYNVDEPDETYGVLFKPTQIVWKYDEPNTMEEQIVVLNQISQHCDRLATSYISLTGEDLTGASDIHETSITFDEPNSFPSIGLVNINNYQSKILEIQDRLRSFKTLRWPMSKKRISLNEDQTYSSDMSAFLLNLGERGVRSLGKAMILIVWLRREVSSLFCFLLLGMKRYSLLKVIAR